LACYLLIPEEELRLWGPFLFLQSLGAVTSALLTVLFSRAVLKVAFLVTVSAGLSTLSLSYSELSAEMQSLYPISEAPVNSSDPISDPGPGA
jgi:hypothetical protein